MDNINKVYERIESLYLEKGLTRKQFETELGLPQSFLSDLKSNRAKAPSAKRLQEISNYFGANADWILGLTDERTVDIDSLENFPINREGLFTLADMGIVKFISVDDKGNLVANINEKDIPRLFNDSQILSRVAEIAFERILNILGLPLEAKDDLISAILPIWSKYKNEDK